MRENECVRLCERERVCETECECVCGREYVLGGCECACEPGSVHESTAPRESCRVSGLDAKALRPAYEFPRLPVREGRKRARPRAATNCSPESLSWECRWFRGLQAGVAFRENGGKPRERGGLWGRGTRERETLPPRGEAAGGRGRTGKAARQRPAGGRAADRRR